MSKKKTKDGRSVTGRTLHYFWGVTKSQMGFFLLGIFSTLGYVAFLSYLNTFYMSRIVDRVTEGGVGAGDVFRVFGPFIFALVLVNALGQICSKLQDYAVWKMEINANYDLATHCFDTLSNQSMTFHTNRYGGSLVSQTSKFMGAYAQLLEIMIYSVLPLIFAVILIVVMLVRLVPYYVAALLVMLVIYVTVAYLMYKKVLPLNAAAAHAQNELSGELSDSVTNILSVKTYGREDYERQLFDAANEEVVRADSRRMRSSNVRGAMTSTIIVAIMVVMTIFLAGGNAWFGISAGTLVMMFTYTYELTLRFNMINSTMQRLNRAFGDAEEMTKILDEPTLVADNADAEPLTVTDGDIVFDDLSFRYMDQESPEGQKTARSKPGKSQVAAVSGDSKTAAVSGNSKTTAFSGASKTAAVSGDSETAAVSDDSKTAAVSGNSKTAAVPSDSKTTAGTTDNVFTDFNLHIPAGQRIGLVGRSGSGKTTLTKLLLRLSDIQEGQILVDGQNISACTQQSLRRQIAYVPQEALLFHRSIRENIAYGKPDATDEEVRKAAAEANALEFIERLPNGMQTMVGERGIKLSGGQRQRIAIARAILADAPILVLDEATSALDSESEKLVQDALVNLMRGRTSIVVAHRLSTVASLDRIIVLADGKIAEDGTHAELIERDGEYAHLWDRQTGAFLESSVSAEE